MTLVSKRAARPSDVARLAPLPREVRLTAGGTALAVVAVVLAAAAVAAAIGMSILRLRQADARETRLRDGVRSTATVASATKSKGEHPRWTVTYRYTAPDGEHSHTARLPEGDRRSFVEGDPIAIEYLGSEPSRSWVAGDQPGVLPLAVVPVASASLLFAAGLMAWSVRRERTLLMEGRMAEARIVSTRKVQHSHHHAYRIAYEFTTLSGATVVSSTEKSRAPGGVGSTIRVVYHRDDPRWNAVYPMPLVTPLLPENRQRNV
jgi:hypothetical protein